MAGTQQKVQTSLVGNFNFIILNNMYKELSASELTEIYGGERSFWENVGYNTRVLLKKIDKALNDWSESYQESVFEEIASGHFPAD